MKYRPGRTLNRIPSTPSRHGTTAPPSAHALPREIQILALFVFASLQALRLAAEVQGRWCWRGGCQRASPWPGEKPRGRQERAPPRVPGRDPTQPMLKGQLRDAMERPRARRRAYACAHAPRRKQATVHGRSRGGVLQRGSQVW